MLLVNNNNKKLYNWFLRKIPVLSHFLSILQNFKLMYYIFRTVLLLKLQIYYYFVVDVDVANI